jgi:hypothetical protein
MNPRGKAFRTFANTLQIGSVLGALGAGCGTEPSEQPTAQEAPLEPAFITKNDAAAKQFNMIVRVYVEQDHVIEFFEPEAGHILVSEAGVAGLAPVAGVEDGVSVEPVALFKRLLPNATVPPALTDAVDRMHRAQSGIEMTDVDLASVQNVKPAIVFSEKAMRPSAQDATVANSNISTTRSALSGGSCPSEWFVAQPQFCPTSGSFNAFNWCTTNWTGGRTVSGTTDSTRGTACADISGFTFNVTTTNSRGGGSWTVDQGTYRWWDSNVQLCGPLSFWCDFKVTYTITNAPGRFHFGGKILHRD